MNENMTQCQCEKDLHGYACVCPCGASMRSKVAAVFHVCNTQPTVLSRSKTASVASSGPGTELKKLLKLIGITATPNCSCNAKARVMDSNGCDWCEAHLDEIVGWLREEAAKRGLPFVDMAGRVLVRRAIALARKAQARAAQAKATDAGQPAV